MTSPFSRLVGKLVSLGPDLVNLGLRGIGASAYHVKSMTHTIIDETKAGYTEAASPVPEETPSEPKPMATGT